MINELPSKNEIALLMLHALVTGNASQPGFSHKSLSLVYKAFDFAEAFLERAQEEEPGVCE